MRQRPQWAYTTGMQVGNAYRGHTPPHAVCRVGTTRHGYGPGRARRRRPAGLLWLAVVLAAAPALADTAMQADTAMHADTATLADGDTVRGRVSRVEEGVLVFRTELAGQLMVPMDTLAGLRTDGNFMVTRQDGSVAYGRFVREAGANALAPLGGGPPQPLPLAEVYEALPLPASESERNSRLRGSVGLGVRGGLAEDNTLTPNLRIELERDWPGGAELRADAAVAGDANGTFPESAAVNLRARGPGGLAPAAALRAERDLAAALEGRAELSLGLEQRWAGAAEEEVDLFAGLSAAYEAWDARELQRRRGGEDEAIGRELNLELRLRYARALFDFASLEQEVYLLPSLSEAGEVRAGSEAGLRFPLRDNLNLRLQLRVEYDSDPGLDRLDRLRGSVGAMFEYGF